MRTIPERLKDLARSFKIIMADLFPESSVIAGYAQSGGNFIEIKWSDKKVILVDDVGTLKLIMNVKSTLSSQYTYLIRPTVGKDKLDVFEVQAIIDYILVNAMKMSLDTYYILGTSQDIHSISYIDFLSNLGTGFIRTYVEFINKLSVRKDDRIAREYS